jgi:hypothetical protein
VAFAFVGETIMQKFRAAAVAGLIGIAGIAFAPASFAGPKGAGGPPVAKYGYNSGYKKGYGQGYGKGWNQGYNKGSSKGGGNWGNGFATGAILGLGVGVIAASPKPYYAPPPPRVYYAPPPVIYAPPPPVVYAPPPPPPVYYGRAWTEAHVEWCITRYRSYNPATNTFVGYDGYVHQCVGPYWGG